MILPYVFAAIATAIYLLELWMGVALAGWSAHQTIVVREKEPKKYWFAMTVQVIAFIVMAAIALNYRR